MKTLIGLFLIALLVAGCAGSPVQTTLAAAPAISPQAPTTLPSPTALPPQPLPASFLDDYAFPETIDPAARYLFYLHGRIVEEQGLHAVDPVFGEYQYLPILQKLGSHGFVVISEQRPRNPDVARYAGRVVAQVKTLLHAGVPPENITVAGASKGAFITVFISHELANPAVNFVLLAICNPETVGDFVQNQISLSGNVLSIYDSVDNFGGSCQELFDYSEGKGLSRHEEIVLHIGAGHGILYQPMDQWINPLVQWAGEK